MRGTLIAIEGLDGSGKATQTALLRAFLAEQGVPVRQVSFPDYGSDASALVRLYLSGAFGSEAGAVNAYAASSFYAVDRYASFRRDWGAFLLDGGTVIADRYTTSNAIHQCAKLPEADRDGFLDWLFHYEYDLLGLPAPDMVVYLRVGEAVRDALLTKRYQGDAEKKDLHERDRAYQRRCAAAAEYCCARLRWTAVDCVRGGVLRSAEDVHGEIAERVRQCHPGLNA